MGDLLEIFKTLGAVVAFATGAFTIWDRMLSSQPVVSFEFDTPPGGIRQRFCLRLDNVSKRNVIIESIEYDREGIQHFFKSDGLEDIEIAFGKQRFAFIKPGEVRLVYLRVNDGFLKDQAELGLTTTVEWRRHGSRLLCGLPVKLRTTNELLRAMERDGSKSKD